MNGNKNNYMFSTSNNILPHKKKITFNQFMKTIWMLSNTNLHYIDFKNTFEDDMKRMYHIVKINV